MPEFNFTSFPPLSLYVHLPWCIQKCPYCDFNSYAAGNQLPEVEYLQALLSDLEHELPNARNRIINTVFFGGGTPSLLSPEIIDQLLCAIRSKYTLRPNAEITLETNPGTFEQEKFKEFRAVGINRLSIGAQSFDDELLRNIGRVHDGKAAIHAAEMAHKVGFENFNIDLIYGLPGQSELNSQADLITAVQLNPSHISYYQLTIEPNTEFHAQPPTLPDEEQVWAMQTQGDIFLVNHGYTQYEVSAYAYPGKQCEHNRNYWEFGDYLGIGAGAHGKLTQLATQSIYRSSKAKQPKWYMKSGSDNAWQRKIRVIKPPDAIFEFMLNALRLRSGFDLSLFKARTGLSTRSIAPKLAAAAAKGLLNFDGRKILPTDLGRRFLNDLSLLFLHDSTSGVDDY